MSPRKILSTTCQSNTLNGRVLGGWAWLCSTTLAVISRPSNNVGLQFSKMSATFVATFLHRRKMTIQRALVHHSVSVTCHSVYRPTVTIHTTTVYKLCTFVVTSVTFRAVARSLSLGGLEPMASAKRESITGVWGRSPQRGPGAEPLVGGQGGEAPPLKLKAFYLSEVVRKPQNASFGAFWKPTKIHVSTMS